MTSSRNESRPADGPSLSVVVVTYDEADRIDTCLGSILDATASIPGTEIVVVDSRSNDDTVPRALAYPVDVYRLPADPPRTPSAGRYVGTKLTTGELVLFVDGDMELETGWLADACRDVQRDPALAGLDGELAGRGGEQEGDVEYLRGVALYDRAALASVGGFDPFMEGLEDVDLGFRLRSAGYELRRLPTVVADHPGGASGVREQLRRWRNGYYRGRGQLVRKALGSRSILRRVLYKERLYVVGLCWILGSVVAVAGFGERGVLASLGSLAAAVAGLSVLKSPGWALRELLYAPLIYAGTVQGALASRPPPEAYPLGTVEGVRAHGRRASNPT
ncbi:MAG: glycosyltransferase family 2 protein [Haloarculaceae archaeon]